MSKSNYAEHRVQRMFFGGVAYTPPATLDIALYTASAGETGGGTEVSGGSYARANVTNNSTTFPDPGVGNPSTNGVEISFPTATANWGTVIAWAAFEGGTSNMLYYGALTTPETINSGHPSSFPPGSLVVTED